MNIEQLQDAINLLDDDLIEEVDKIRNQELYATGRTNRKQWYRLVSIAACLCILGISTYATKELWLGNLGTKGITADQESDGLTTNEEMEEKADGEEDTIAGLESVSGETENYTSDCQSENPSDDTSGNASENTSTTMPSMYVEITGWQEDGFYGTARNEVDAGLLTEGTKVFVKLDSQISIDKEKLPAGSLVLVKYMTSGEEFNAEDDSSIRKILYAEEVGLVKED